MLLAAVLVVLSVAAVAPASSAAQSGSPYQPGVVLVGFRPGVSAADRALIERRIGASRSRALDRASASTWRARWLGRQLGLTFELRVRLGSVMGVIARLRRERRWVRFAEPDYLMRASGVTNVPNDPSFGLQWGSLNTGQSVNGIGGTAGADDGAARAWTVTTGSRSIVVGQVDTGLDYNHPDLAANVWNNPGGIGGCAAGTHGYNVLRGTCDPMDDDAVYGGHGSHTAGIIGAVGNNGAGVAGTNWATTIVPVKWLNSQAWGSDDELISALNWLVQAKQAGVNIRVINDSATFAGDAYSQALSDEIGLLGANNILFVTAAGNSGQNNDNPAYTRYPCGYDQPNQICATATNQNDQLPSYANWGVNTVDLGAPGDNIYSTLRNGSYGYISGGSMAAAEVSGAAALILSAEPSLSATSLKADILNNVDPIPALSGMVRTGGRLDVCKAIPSCGSAQTGTLGTTTIGGSTESFVANRKAVDQYALPVPASVTKLSVYLGPTGTSGTATLEGVVYADASGAPGALLGTTTPVSHSSSQAKGWYTLTFPSPVVMAAGKYWIGLIAGGKSGVAGVRYASGATREYNSNTYTSGPSNPFGAASSNSELMSLYATYTSSGGSPPPPPPPPAPPANTALPTISGLAQSGQTLTASTGSWSNSPTSYAYAWQRCDSSGVNCTAISSATTSSYAVTSADVGSTLAVTVVAANAGGSSAPATSSPTAVVTTATSTGTFGKTAVGGSVDGGMFSGYKIVNSAILSSAGAVTKLSVYAVPGIASSGSEQLKAVIYADAGGVPGALLATGTEVSYQGSSNGTGWFNLPFASAVNLSPGTYWIGFITGGTSEALGYRYDTVAGSRAYNSNAYSSGPTNPFGSATVDSEQASLYATYTTS